MNMNNIIPCPAVQVQVTLESYLHQLGHGHRGPDEGPGDQPLVEDVLDPGVERDGEGVEEGVPAQDGQPVAAQRRDLQVQQLVLPVKLSFRRLLIKYLNLSERSPDLRAQSAVGGAEVC